MNIENLIIDFKYDELKDKIFLIGFFLCVYFYVFELDMIVKIIGIFDNLKFYVVYYIIIEIEKDKFYEVKILFFYLLFYFN